MTVERFGSQPSEDSDRGTLVLVDAIWNRLRSERPHIGPDPGVNALIELRDRCEAYESALRYMADYQMTGTEMTLHIDFQGKAREALAAHTVSRPSPSPDPEGEQP